MRIAGRRDDGGAAAVEFALVVLPLLYLVFGVIEYGYMLNVRQSISQAAAEGARAAAVTTGDPQTAARGAVTDALSGYSLVCEAGGDLTTDSRTVGECTVSDPSRCASGTTEAECVRLTLAYDYEPLVGFGFGFLLPDQLVYTTDVQVG